MNKKFFFAGGLLLLAFTHVGPTAHGQNCKSANLEPIKRAIQNAYGEIPEAPQRLKGFPPEVDRLLNVLRGRGLEVIDPALEERELGSSLPPRSYSVSINLKNPKNQAKNSKVWRLLVSRVGNYMALQLIGELDKKSSWLSGTEADPIVMVFKRSSYKIVSSKFFACATSYDSAPTIYNALFRDGNP
jgi:hypothetical protein